MPILLPETQKALPEVEKQPKKIKVKVKVQQRTGPSRLWFASDVKANAPTTPREKKPRVKVKANPAHVAAARELRDRYLEQFNSGLVLPSSTSSGQAGGKYEVSRQIEAKMVEPKMLAA